MKLPFLKSRLRKAIERGLSNGKLREELMELDDLVLKTASDAEDVIWGLEQLGKERANLGRDVYALTRLFQDVDEEEGADAFERLQERGIPELLRLYDELKAAAETDDLLFLLKILGMYGTVQGTLKIVEAAREPFKPDGYLWTVIFSSFCGGHPEKELLFQSLSEPLPPGFIGVSLLDAANTAAREDQSFLHPFDTSEGKVKLREWLSSTAPGEFSYAHSATAALPFISEPEQGELLNVAMNHADVGVRMEGAWASAKLGRQDGIERLAKLCLDFKTAETAKHYLTELGLQEAIPKEANDPTFNAVSQFALWLAHPNELGRAPDEMDVVDHRELRWPPGRDLKPFWLIRYNAYDRTGLEDDNVECGVVGSVTFCFFTYKLAERPPEDGYAIHCYWEMEQQGLIEELDVRGEGNEYLSLLGEWTGAPLKNAQMLAVAEISPEFNYPQRLVGLASASLDGAEGWVVLDGQRSEWYPRDEQPEGSYESLVLKVHVGRHLLGFTEKPNRKKYLWPAKPPKPAEQVIRGYEKLLKDAQTAHEEKQKGLDGFGPISNHFEAYLRSLEATGRGSEIRGFITFMAPHWEHPSGYATLGNAALKFGHVDLAEEFFVKYRNSCANYERGEEMGLLAKIWIEKGRRDEAKELLVTSVQRIFEESKTADGSDIDLFEKWFQQQRGVLLKLFPGEGEKDLEEKRIPESTLRRQ